MERASSPQHSPFTPFPVTLRWKKEAAPGDHTHPGDHAPLHLGRGLEVLGEENIRNLHCFTSGRQDDKCQQNTSTEAQTPLTTTVLTHQEEAVKLVQVLWVSCHCIPCSLFLWLLLPALVEMLAAPHDLLCEVLCEDRVLKLGGVDWGHSLPHHLPQGLVECLVPQSPQHHTSKGSF